MKGLRIVAVVLAASALAGASFSQREPADASPRVSSDIDPAAGIMNLDHLIIVVQENRSFDHYFGTFPGADGLPRAPDGPSRYR